MQNLAPPLTHTADLSKSDYKAREATLRLELLEVQKQLATSGKAVLILMNGVEGSGKGETIKKLLEWIDARGVEVTAFWTASGEFEEHPMLWRFWNKLPPKGRMGIFFGSWYTQPIIDRVFRNITKDAFAQQLDEIAKLERMLTAEGVILIKLWLYLDQNEQKKMLQTARKKKSATSWRISKIARKFARKRKRFHKIDMEALAATHTGHAPWTVIDARFENRRELIVGETILGKLTEQIAGTGNSPDYAGIWSPATRNLLEELDSSLKMSDAEFDDRFNKLTLKMRTLTDDLSLSKRNLVLVFEGPDAAGKGGAIRRVIHAVDPRHYRMIAISAPTDIEKAHPYLWRFWQDTPGHGKIHIFDRSWYGRVLVERIERFCTENEWQRAFGEIRDFEQSMIATGSIIRKFYLSTTSDEQLARFKVRKITPYKQYKLTEEDWRNRDKWNAYQGAASDMVVNTSTADAPWILVEANDKNFARIKVLEAVCTALEDALEK
jgi:AMP-polyphosphate phosphotransferase